VKIEGTTVCPEGHDMTKPGMWVQVKPDGRHGQCKVCRSLRQRDYRHSQNTRCRECGCDHPPSTSSFCSARCQGIAHARNRIEARRGIQDRRDDRTLAILRLHDEKWRASTHWERAAIDAKIREMSAL
jgi:hypothetical protein